MGHHNDTNIEGAKLNRAVIRRAWGYATPYRKQLAGFLIVILTSALISLVPPLLFREILDDAIPNHDRTAPPHPRGDHRGLPPWPTLASRWPSAICRRSIGEGLIYDLRVALFDHVQRMPIAVLHPHPDRRAHQPHEQRRDRRPTGRHRHPRLGGVQRRRPAGQRRRDRAARVAARVARPWSCCRCSSCRPSGWAAGCRCSPASRWTSTPR